MQTIHNIIQTKNLFDENLIQLGVIFQPLQNITSVMLNSDFSKIVHLIRLQK